MFFLVFEFADADDGVVEFVDTVVEFVAVVGVVEHIAFVFLGESHQFGVGVGRADDASSCVRVRHRWGLRSGRS